MKKILYVTGSRAEYGIVRRLLTMLRETPEIQLDLAVTGMHCDNAYGNTIHIIEQDNFNIIKVVDININTTSHTHILHSMSVCLNSFGDFFSNNTYDAVMVLGDRYEIFSVAIAASMHNIPLIHIHGGEKTLANYDEFIRHSITKMSKLHLTSTEEYKKRVIQLGEKPGSVFNIGSLGAENALSLHLPNKQELELKYGSLLKRYFVVVFHPETLSTQSVNDQIDELLSAISFFKNTHDFIFIGSNADTGSDIIQRITGALGDGNQHDVHDADAAHHQGNGGDPDQLAVGGFRQALQLGGLLQQVLCLIGQLAVGDHLTVQVIRHAASGLGHIVGGGGPHGYVHGFVVAEGDGPAALRDHNGAGGGAGVHLIILYTVDDRLGGDPLAHHAHHGEGFALHLDDAADGVLSGKQALGRRRIDDGYLAAGGEILR